MNKISKFYVSIFLVTTFISVSCTKKISSLKKVEESSQKTSGDLEKVTNQKDSSPGAYSSESPIPSNSSNSSKNSTDNTKQKKDIDNQVLFAKNELLWKRYKSLEDSLASGLDLDLDQICKEVGVYSCFNKVYLSALGGNQPFNLSQYNRPLNPTIITPISLERIILSACEARIEKDILLESNAKIFRYISLDSKKPGVEDLKKQTVFLYRKLLLRDPIEEEMKTILEFSDNPLSGRQLAKSLCFAIGSSIEIIFI